MKLVVNLRAIAPLWRIPQEIEQEIVRGAPAGWTVEIVETDTVSDGDGGHPPTPQALAAIADADVFFGFGVTRTGFLAANNLKWVHSATAGIGGALFDEMKTSSVVLTNSAGVHAVPMAEYVLAGLLHFWRGFDYTLDDQRNGQWVRERFLSAECALREIGGSTVVIVGTGGIGVECATRLTALGATCVGVRRRPAEGAPAGFQRVTGLGGLDALLPGADAVVLAAPLTGDTRGIMNAARLDLLPTHAIVINVARGPLLDEAALAARLADGRLRGAALDVFAMEPLAPDSPLWQLRRSLVTPHISAVTPKRFWEREVALFFDNWKRFVAGAPLRNVVNKQAGY